MINTSGFGVSAIQPVRYTAPETANMVQDPNKFTDGVLAAFKVAGEKEKLDAFRHQQDELKELRSTRVQHAKDLAALTQMLREKTSQTQDKEIALANTEASVGIGVGQGKLDRMDLENVFNKNAAIHRNSQQGILNQINAESNQNALDVQGAKDVTAIDEAERAALIAGQKLADTDTETQTTSDQTQLNAAKVQHDLAIQAAKNKMEIANLEYQAKNATTEAERQDILFKLQVKKTEAETGKTIQEGNYYGERTTYGKDPAAVATSLIGHSSNTLKSMVMDGSGERMMLSDYIQKKQSDPEFVGSELGDRLMESYNESQNQIHDAFLESSAARALRNKKAAAKAAKYDDSGSVSISYPGMAKETPTTNVDTPVKIKDWKEVLTLEPNARYIGPDGVTYRRRQKD